MNNIEPAPGTSPAGNAPSLDVAKLIDQYVQLRDRKRELEDAHKKTIQPYTKVMDLIASQLLTYMQRMNLDNVSTPGGSAYQSVKHNATIRDGALFRDYVKSSGNYDLVDWRANANAVFDFIEENGGRAPPGVNASSFTKVHVLRPNEKE